MRDSLTIRWAEASDIPTILRFIHELAEYEREPDAVHATAEGLLRDGFSGEPRFRCLIAESDGDPVGFALFFRTYSTWRGHHGLWLEDLYVTPSWRGRGIGSQLLSRVAQQAVEEGCPRLEWNVLTWNSPAISVYQQAGAESMEEWRTMRIADEKLKALAGRLPAHPGNNR